MQHNDVYLHVTPVEHYGFGYAHDDPVVNVDLLRQAIDELPADKRRLIDGPTQTVITPPAPAADYIKFKDMIAGYVRSTAKVLGTNNRGIVGYRTVFTDPEFLESHQVLLDLLSKASGQKGMYEPKFFTQVTYEWQ
jgi:hypothetical protein